MLSETMHEISKIMTPQRMGAQTGTSEYLQLDARQFHSSNSDPHPFSAGGNWNCPYLSRIRNDEKPGMVLAHGDQASTVSLLNEDLLYLLPAKHLSFHPYLHIADVSPCCLRKCLLHGPPFMLIITIAFTAGSVKRASFAGAFTRWFTSLLGFWGTIILCVSFCYGYINLMLLFILLLWHSDESYLLKSGCGVIWKNGV